MPKQVASNLAHAVRQYPPQLSFSSCKRILNKEAKLRRSKLRATRRTQCGSIPHDLLCSSYEYYHIRGTNRNERIFYIRPFLLVSLHSSGLCSAHANGAPLHCATFPMANREGCNKVRARPRRARLLYVRYKRSCFTEFAANASYF